MHSTAQIDALARSQFGVVSRTQAEALGVSYRAQRRMVDRGVWRLHHGALVVLRDEFAADLVDATALGLRCGAESTVTGPTALRLHRWHVPDRILVVSCPPNTNRVLLPNVRILRDDYDRRRSRRGPFTLAHPTEALLDTIRVVSESRARDIVDLALQSRWVDPNEWPRLVGPRLGRGHDGAVRLRALVEHVALGTHSAAERTAVGLIRRARLRGWVPNFPLRDGSGRIVAELDLAHPELRICIEVDGHEAHSGIGQFERDRARQNLLVLEGWLVLRFTWRQLSFEPDAVIRAIREAVALRRRQAAA